MWLRVVVYVAGTVAPVGFVAAVAVLDAERDAWDASITTFGDALWWTVTTITTVGCGDRYPVTTEGRIVAGALMVGGIALLGVVTASIASWFVQTVRATERDVERDVERTGPTRGGARRAAGGECSARRARGGRRQNCRCPAAGCTSTRPRPQQIMIMPVW